MPRLLHIESNLVETDSPELLLARDAAGGVYLCLLVSRTDRGDQFLCIATSASRLEALYSGALDLRHAFQNSENGEAFRGHFGLIHEVPSLELSPLAGIPENWLPDEGFPLAMFVGTEGLRAGDLRLAAVSKRASVGVLALNPPEAQYANRIDSYHLSTGLKLFQDLLKQAGERAWRELRKDTKALLGAEADFTFQVLPQFSIGSFEIHFESKAGNAVDLSGSTAMGVALEKVDEITRYINDVESALPVLRDNSGHLIRAYQALLRFVATEKVPLSYSWAQPGTQIPPQRQIGVDSAQRTYELLAASADLSAVEVVLVGRFVDIGEKGDGGHWKLDVGKKARIRGEMIEGATDLLDGVAFKTVIYRVVCEERLATSLVSGKSRKLYFLKERPTPVSSDPRA